jgi:hypothetical protein
LAVYDFRSAQIIVDTAVTAPSSFAGDSLSGIGADRRSFKRE